MTRQELLLVHLAEECSEVQIRISKALRFGMLESQEGHADNTARLEEELIDLLALIDILQDHQVLSIPTFEVPYDLTRSKRLRVQRYLDYSRKLGVLVD